MATTASWPTIQYETFWAVSKLTDSILKTLSVWIPANAIMLSVSMYNEWPPVIPQVFSIATLAGFLRLFGKVPSWHNQVQTEPPARPRPAPEDARQFVGWETETHTKTTQRLEWYHSPIPIPQARSFALALVSNHFEWFDERDLKEHRANISHSNYRTLRWDWLNRDWCTETGDRKTVIVNKTMIRRIAFESPE